MADVITSSQAADLLLLVAPGYIGVSTYGQRFPQRPSEFSSRIIPSVVLSLPLVATANALARWWNVDVDPLRLPYLTIIVVLAALVGHGAALLFGSGLGRKCLGWLGVGGPERTVADRVLRRLPREEVVTVTFKDGRSLSGYPRYGTNDPDLTRQELFLTGTAWFAEDGEDPWPNRRTDGGVLIDLADVAMIEMEVDAG